MTGAHVRRFQLAILLIMLLAFGLRLYAIDRQGIWGDEAFSIWLSKQPLPNVIAGGADTHPPLYPFLLYLWLRLAGSSPLAVRFLSALIGTLAVAVIYALGCRIFDRRTAGLAALFAATSPVLVYYSQETRMYGLVTLLAAASIYWTIRVLAKQEAKASASKLPYAAYFLATIGAVYTHYYAFFVVLAENLVVLPYLFRHRQWPAVRRWLLTQGALAAAYVPWIAVQSRFLGGKASARFDEWSLGTALRIAGQTVAAFGAGPAVPSAIAWIVAILFLIAVAAGLVGLLRQHRLAPWLMVAYLLIPLLLAWAVNPIMPFFYARYLLLIAPAFYLLAAWGTMAWDASVRSAAAFDAAASHPARWGRVWSSLAAVILLAGSGTGLFSYYTNDVYLKSRYGEMMAYVKANAQSGDALILANQLQRPIFQYYQPQGIDAYFFPRYEYPLEDPQTAGDLESIAASHPRLWLVRFGNPAEYDPDGYLSRWLATHGSKAYFGGWIDAELSLYVMAPASGTGRTIQHPLSVDLGDQVRLLGYALSADRVVPGDPLLLTIYWQALSPISERYTVFTHLLDANNRIQAQMDGEPQGGALPTDRWIPGQIVQDNYALIVAGDAQPGPHVLEVGMYLLDTLERLPIRDANTGVVLGDRVLLGSVEVIAP
jgi:mannosyltransferase